MPTGIVTVSSYTAEPPVQIDPASEFEVRGFYTRDFIAGDGVTPLYGNSTSGNEGPYYDVDSALNASGNLVVPAHDIQATTLSNPTANYFEGLWVDGAFVRWLMPNTQAATGWAIPTIYGSVIAIDEIALYNRAKRLLYPPDTYPTFNEVILLIQRLAGNFDYMAVGVNGIGEASWPPVVASAPQVLMENDPKVASFVNIIAYFADEGSTAAQNSVAIANANTAAAVTGAGLYIPVGTFPVNNLSLTVPVMFAPGASILQPQTGRTVGFTKPIIADPSKHFDNALAGQGTISFAGNIATPTLLPEWWGNNTVPGTTDMTPPVQAAVTATPSAGGTVGFQTSTYKIVAGVQIARGYINLQGAGQGATIIQYAPAGNGSCFFVGGTGSVIPEFTIDGMSFMTADQSFTKTALYVEDLTNGCRISNITIGGNGANANIQVTGVSSAPMWHDSTGTSIGIHTHGRDLTTVEHVNVWADRPVVGSANPNSGGAANNEDMDQWVWRDCYFIGYGSGGNHIFEMEAGLGMDNVSFVGRQSWAAGAGGFKMNDTRAAPGIVLSQGLTFENIRYEQACQITAGPTFTQPSTGFGFDIVQMGGIDVSFKNCEVGGDSNGFKVSGVFQVNYVSCVSATPAGTSMLMIPLGGANPSIVTMQNCSWQAGSTFDMTTGGYILVAGSRDAANYAGPSNAVYSAQALPFTIGLPANAGFGVAALHVFRDSATGAQFIFQNPNAGAASEARMRIQSDSAETAFIVESITNGQTVQWQGSGNAALVINQVSNAPLTIQTNNTERMRVLAGGNVGIGTTVPTSILHVVGLPVFANNAAAILGGLTAGALYRTGADPDLVAVVH